MWRTPKLCCAAVSALALFVAGCGGGGASSDGDPASAVPADAAVYLELVVRPEGSLRDDALAAAGKVLATDDPEGELQAHMALAFDDVEFDYDRDVAPWLGERAGFWLRPTPEQDDFGVLVLSATDTEEARTALEASLKRNGESFTERSHRGSDYLLADDVAAGVVGDFVAIGPEAAYKRTVDAAEGDSLAETDEYADAVDDLEGERLAHFWVDTPALVELARESDPEFRAQADQLSTLVPLDDLPPITGSFAADGDGLRLEARVRAERQPFGPLLAGGSTPLIQELPGDSWAAMGAADVGKSLSETVDGLAGAIGGIAVRREVRRQTGLDLDRDLLDWVGHVAFFVRGTTPATLDGGVVIQPTDEERAAAALPRLVGAVQVARKVRAEPVDIAGADQAFEIPLPDAPRPLVLARGEGLVVATLGRQAAEAALGSGDRLGESDVYAEAEELVGMEPSLLISMPELLELMPASKPDRSLERLEAFSVLAAGVVVDDGEAIGRLAAGLR